MYRSLYRYTTPLLLIISVAIAVLTLYITGRQAAYLEDEERSKLELWVEAMRRMADLEYAQEDYSILLKIIERNDNLPLILTDASHFPLSVRNVPPERLHQPGGVEALIEEYAAANDPIVIRLPSGKVNYVYYGFSPILRQLRYFPYIQLTIIVVMIIIAYAIYRSARVAEQNRVWVGMARETAHQLGTPISSLMAWTQILQDENAYPELVASLQLDVDRLHRVADRFSKIGGTPLLEETDIRETIARSVEYMRPRIARRIQLIFTQGDGDYPVPHNATLMGWVIENLIRNSVDAIEGEGVIAIGLRFTQTHAIIDCSDSGKGIPRAYKKRIFKPGFSTKTRGWGLGLSLARRIVHEYHRGRIFVLRSDAQQGSTIRIILNIQGMCYRFRWMNETLLGLRG